MLKRFIYVFAVCLMWTLQVSAQIKTETVLRYNAAVDAGDRNDLIDAASDLAREAMASPENEQAALLAYEAAWKLCQNGECQKAIRPARFAVDQPSTGAHPVRADRELLLAYADWKSRPGRENREALDAALNNMSDVSASPLSVSAFQGRYVYDLEKNDFSRSEATARAAAAHFYPLRETLGAIWADAELATHVSSFNGRSDPDAMIGVAQLTVYLDRQSYVVGGAPPWMMERFYRSIAWRHAMAAYFTSVDEAEDERIYAEKISSDAEVSANLKAGLTLALAEHGELPRCGGALSSAPKPRFPSIAAVRGNYGSVLLGLDVAVSGAITPSVKASVPSERFEAAALKSIEDIVWEWEDPAPGQPACQRMSFKTILPFSFTLR